MLPVSIRAGLDSQSLHGSVNSTPDMNSDLFNFLNDWKDEEATPALTLKYQHLVACVSTYVSKVNVCVHICVCVCACVCVWWGGL